MSTLLHLCLASMSSLVVAIPQEVSPESGARALLERLEAAHAEVDVFVSPLTYRKEYGLEGDFETRIGEVSVKGEGPRREMMLVFDRIIDVSGHGTDQAEFHLFQQGWWTELDPRRKNFIRRQIVAPGSSDDPFELGKGPLPLPFKQDADEVMRRFKVSLGTVPDEPLFRSIKEAEVLHLVPRPGTPASEDHESIDLLYDRETLLPIGMRFTHRNGDRTTAWLRKPSGRAEDDPSDGRIEQFNQLIARARTEPGWRIESRPLPPAEAAPSRDGAD
ncbi:MAG: hypothetical protein VXX86_04680 [Planctomycetota bacterium]|nr:hypothetical protein [Planctomycetota bacterium]MED6307245.1 hypothetical protein [Planctomycetota bacterium]